MGFCSFFHPLCVVFVCCPTSILGHSIYILLPHLSHVAQHSEDDKARQEASQTVYRAGDQSISGMKERRGLGIRKTTEL